MNIGIEGRVALVTGASRGIGRAIAAALVAEGAQVAVSSRSPERIEATAGQIGAVPLVHDSDDVDSAAPLVGQVGERLGPVEILIVNTGGPPAHADGAAISREQWEAAYRSLVLTPMALIEAVAPSMHGRRWGRIVNISSMAVREVIDPLLLSNAHRSAMLATFKTLARQLAASGITLNTLLPGRIATERLSDLYGSLPAAEAAAAQEIPAGRLGRPEEMAAAATFLCSEAAAYITGVSLLVDGGLTRSP